MMCLAATPSRADTLPPQVQALLPKDGPGLADSGAWQLADLFGWLWRQFGAGTAQPVHFAGQAAAYLLLACVVGLVCAGTGWKQCLDAVATLGFGAMSLAAMMELVVKVSETAQQSQTYLTAFVPVFSGVLLLGGQGNGAAGYGGLFFSISVFLSIAIERVLLPILRVYFCFAVSAALWANPGIEQAADLFARCFGWLLKACGTLFGFVLGLQGILTGVADSAALRMGSSALAGAIPIVGDAAAAALRSAAAAVHLLKGVLALALVSTLGAAFLPAFLSCALYYLAFSAAGILAAGSGQRQCGRICRLLADGARLCAAILILYFFMVFLSTALMLVMGNGG